MRLKKKKNRLRVLQPYVTRSILKPAESVTPDDVVIEGDLRLLNYADKVRGIQRKPITLSYKRNVDDLVLVERTKRRGDVEYVQRHWIKGEYVRPDDIVILNGQNVKPYWYAKREREPKPYKPPHGPHRGSGHYRRLAALMNKIIHRND